MKRGVKLSSKTTPITEQSPTKPRTAEWMFCPTVTVSDIVLAREKSRIMIIKGEIK